MDVDVTSNEFNTLIQNVSFNDSGNTTASSSYIGSKYVAIVTSLICCLGVIGNIINIVVLRMRRVQTGLDYVGRAAILGLLALACSDLLFCAVGVFSGVVVTLLTGEVRAGEGSMRRAVIIGFMLNMYRSACINLLLFTSTWCITLLSVERYIVVCHPFRTTQYVTGVSVIVSRIIVVIISIVINFPLFMRFEVHHYNCGANITCFYSSSSESTAREPLLTFHLVSWALVGTVLPLVLLLTTSVLLLLRVIRESPGDLRRNGVVIFKVTKTLVAITISFVILVCPSMIFAFFQKQSVTASGVVLDTLVDIANICQAVKFSCNFILYFSINKCFRQTIC